MIYIIMQGFHRMKMTLLQLLVTLLYREVFSKAKPRELQECNG